MWSGSGSLIQDHSDHGTSKKPMNPWPEWIHRFLWCTMIRVILDHWSGSGSHQKTLRPGSYVAFLPCRIQFNTLGLDYDRIINELNMKWVHIYELQSLIIIGLQLLQTTPLGLFEVITVRDWTKWRLCPGVPVHRGNNYCTPLFTSLCLAIAYCWVYCIGSCVPVHEDRTKMADTWWLVSSVVAVSDGVFFFF